MSNFTPPPHDRPPAEPTPPVVPPAGPQTPPGWPPHLPPGVRPMGGGAMPPGPPRRRRSFWGRLFLLLGILVLVGSVVLNVVLAVVVLADIPYISSRTFRTNVVQAGKANQVVAMLEITGGIGDEMAGTVGAFCREVARGKQVKAVLLRVNSPGGGVSACDRIYNQLKQLREQTNKPIVVSMGGVAASGGYYVSAPADAIVAEPTTITGSIGVLGGWAVLKGTMDKIGVKWIIIRSSPAKAWKAAPSYFEEPAKYQIDEVQRTIDSMHKRFEDIVRQQRGGKITVTKALKTYIDAEGKPFTVEESEPFNGRVFLAERAKQLGLVDDVGYLDDAVNEAASLAGLDKPKVVHYTRRKPFSPMMAFGQAKRLGMEMLDEIQTPRIMYLWRVDQ